MNGELNRRPAQDRAGVGGDVLLCDDRSPTCQNNHCPRQLCLELGEPARQRHCVVVESDRPGDDGHCGGAVRGDGGGDDCHCMNRSHRRIREAVRPAHGRAPSIWTHPDSPPLHGTRVEVVLRGQSCRVPRTLGEDHDACGPCASAIGDSPPSHSC